MTFVEILFLALILSIDAFVVSFSYGLNTSKRLLNIPIKLAAGTGLFQFLMPLFGAVLTNLVSLWIQNYSKYIAGTIFIILGLKFIIEKMELSDYKTCESSENIITVKTLLTISIATSIDAMAAGGSMQLLHAPLVKASVMIGLVTFILAFTGFYAGIFMKKLAPNLLSKFGGIILILLGLKTIFL